MIVISKCVLCIIVLPHLTELSDSDNDTDGQCERCKYAPIDAHFCRILSQRHGFEWVLLCILDHLHGVQYYR